jgi:hypothetical protein
VKWDDVLLLVGLGVVVGYIGCLIDWTIHEGRHHPDCEWAGRRL